MRNLSSLLLLPNLYQSQKFFCRMINHSVDCFFEIIAMIKRRQHKKLFTKLQVHLSIVAVVNWSNRNRKFCTNKCPWSTSTLSIQQQEKIQNYTSVPYTGNHNVPIRNTLDRLILKRITIQDIGHYEVLLCYAI